MVEFITIPSMEINPQTWELLNIGIIPFTYGFVGWITNYVALKMTFYPIEFWGIPPYLGWQGIVPRKAHKMATKAVDVITERLFNVEEVFEKVDPKEVETILMPNLIPYIHESIEDFGRTMNNELWESMPQILKDEIRFKVERASRGTVRRVILQMRENISSIIDVKGIVLHCLTGKNVGLIVEVFQRMGAPEFKFIERSGFYFGFLLGLMQMAFWIFLPLAWTLPVQGVIVGYLTNFLALNMIFRPLHPKNYLGYTYQGLFIKRQTEVSKEYAKIVAENILTPSNIIRDIFSGSASEEVANSIQNAVIDQMDNLTSLAKPILVGSGLYIKYETMKIQIAERILQAVLSSTEHLEEYLDEALDLKRSMGERMAELPPKEFEVVLRSAFQEDELLLILIGAALGAIVGLGQMFFL